MKLLNNIIGDQSFGLIKGLSFNNIIEDVRQIEKDGDCYENELPLYNLQCFHKLYNDKDVTYKFVYWFDDETKKLTEINLFFHLTSDKVENITEDEYDSLILKMKEAVIRGSNLKFVKEEKTKKNQEVMLFYETQLPTKNTEVVFMEWNEDDYDSNTEKCFKIVWQLKY